MLATSLTVDVKTNEFCVTLRLAVVNSITSPVVDRMTAFVAVIALGLNQNENVYDWEVGAATDR